MQIVTRFAPSPTGLLHLGHAASALAGWRHAQAAGGRFLLRLEDIDSARCRPEFTAAILQDLAWLGLDWDGVVRVQTAHLAEYRAALDRLDGMGLLYPCFCTRAEIARDVAAAATAPHDPDGAPHYPGTCRLLSASARQRLLAASVPHAWRLDMARAVALAGDRLGFEELATGWRSAAPQRFGDVVLARKDAPSSYHLCVTHDDAAQGVTLVTRGVDLLPATDLHVLLQRLLGWPTPSYAHHALLTDASGRRLAKRDHAASLQGLRAAGHSAAQVRAMATHNPVAAIAARD
jgi:glutamyl-Q tRNA(Asp) synthetase